MKRGRKATGAVTRYILKDGTVRYRARVRMEDGSRVYLPLPEEVDVEDLSAVRAAVTSLQRRVTDGDGHIDAWNTAQRLAVAGAVAPALRRLGDQAAQRRVTRIDKDGNIVGYTTLAEVQKALLFERQIELDVCTFKRPPEAICRQCGMPFKDSGKSRRPKFCPGGCRCSVPGCENRTSSKTVSGKCRSCYRPPIEDHERRCSTPGCPNVRRDSKARSRKLCKSCFESKWKKLDYACSTPGCEHRITYYAATRKSKTQAAAFCSTCRPKQAANPSVCSDCSAPISKGRKRCKSCYLVSTKKPPPQCADCEKPISAETVRQAKRNGTASPRCRACWLAKVTK